MSEKKRDKKLGRNPFDHKKASKPRPQESRSNLISEKIVHPRAADPVAPEVRPPSQPQSNPHPEIPTPAKQAWFFVDLWAGAFMEPYFFWARSMDIMKRSIESTKAEV